MDNYATRKLNRVVRREKYRRAIHIHIASIVVWTVVLLVVGAVDLIVMTSAGWNWPGRVGACVLITGVTMGIVTIAWYVPDNKISGAQSWIMHNTHRYDGTTEEDDD